MPMLAQSGHQANCHGHVADAPALRRRDMALPVGPLDTELPFDEIDIAPFKRHHLAAP